MILNPCTARVARVAPVAISKYPRNAANRLTRVLENGLYYYIFQKKNGELTIGPIFEHCQCYVPGRVGWTEQELFRLAAYEYQPQVYLLMRENNVQGLKLVNLFRVSCEIKTKK